MQRTFELDYIEIVNNDGCWSFVGRQRGKQEVGLDRNGCFYLGTAVHEVIHALGFDHMHKSADRDDYIRIALENIAPDYHQGFDTAPTYWYDNFGTPYDLLSVMHYARNDFSMNGLDTIIPHDSRYLNIIGEGTLSDGDATRLNRMYLCSVR